MVSKPPCHEGAFLNMKVIFIKQHLEWNPGDEVELDEGIAGYLLKVGVVTTEQTDDEAVEKTLVKKLKAAKKKK
jgi:hypothetical protein